MSPILILFIFIAYTALLFAITWVTSKRANNQSFYTGNKASPWFVVAYGMIGASLSGVTFMSVPGQVQSVHFTYMLMVFGNFAGYLTIALILLPLYYRLNLTSIYTYLEKRFGFWSYKTGAGFFMLSRIMGASLRMFLVIYVLQRFVFDSWNVPFWINATIFILLIIIYTLRGGIKTIIWTDTLQTTFMILAVILSVVFICRHTGNSFGQMMTTIKDQGYMRMFDWDWHSERFFLKQFFSGMFVCIAMTGLDQEMMQKNLSCKNLKEAQKNMFTFSVILMGVVFLFLVLGGFLAYYAKTVGVVVEATDDLFPTIALKYMGPVAGVAFMIGLISAAFPSADGALTSLTTSFTIDFLELDKKDISEEEKKKIRYKVHICIALILLTCIIIFKNLNNKAIIDEIFTIAGYTYGPLLGLYAFGLFTNRSVLDKATPAIAIISPVICFLLDKYSVQLFNGYKFGFELLLLNGFITFMGMLLFSKKSDKKII